jgi:hypothetical protein
MNYSTYKGTVIWLSVFVTISMNYVISYEKKFQKPNSCSRMTKRKSYKKHYDINISLPADNITAGPGYLDSRFEPAVGRSFHHCIGGCGQI